MSMMVHDRYDQSVHSERIKEWMNEILLKCKKAIKQSESISQEPKLLKIIELMKWMEGRLLEKINFPRMTNIETARIESIRESPSQILLRNFHTF